MAKRTDQDIRFAIRDGITKLRKVRALLRNRAKKGNCLGLVEHDLDYAKTDLENAKFYLNSARVQLNRREKNKEDKRAGVNSLGVNRL